MRMRGERAAPVGADGACPAILLAAGASLRMGAVKALLPLDDGIPAVCSLARLYESQGGECLVVTGYHAEAVEAAVKRFGSGRVARNPEPERGQLSSLQCGLRALEAASPRPEWFLFAPVDCFDVTADVLADLHRARRSAAPETLFCIPEYQGNHGHPVAARWATAEAFLALSPADNARTVVRRYRNRTLYVPVRGAGALLDYDTPEAFARRGHGFSSLTADDEPAAFPGANQV
ncbi:MAG: nucleotidyltransferase family protein [Bryobacterales bacterium]|nr:nucleotidyltransferase family protein [Bryobacterales bacterium]